MPVPKMSEVAWDGSQTMLSNGPEMSGSRQPPQQQHPQAQPHQFHHQHPVHGGAVRSQDDAMVGYFFQRPQNETVQQYNSKRWAVGDDSAIEQVRSVNEIERDFHNLGFNEREYGPQSKKLWEVEKAGGDQKLFQGASPWTAPREPSWGGNPPGNPHAVSNPINMVHRRPGSFPGSNPGNILSPQSSETSALGVNMVEYVLGGSPTGKDMEARLARMKAYGGAGDGEGGKASAVEQNVKAPSPYEGGDKAQPETESQDNMQTNGIMQNGLEVDKDFRPSGSRHESPTEDQPVTSVPLGTDPQKLAAVAPSAEDLLEGSQAPLPQNPGLHLEASQFEPVGLDPQLFPDYSTSQLMQQMDSPNLAMDYNQQLMTRQQQQPMALLAQQQYALAAQQQQLGLAPTAFAPTPYVINTQDPYAVGIPVAVGPAVVPQYYGVQTPWGIYPAGIVQQGGQQAMTPQQQQQLMRQQQTGRPLTPSQQTDGLGTPTGGMQGQPQPGTLPAPAGYQILAPAYYDQNGQLVMSNPRGIGTPVRLVSPAPVLLNAAGQANGLGNNALRLLTTQQQQGQATPVPYSGSSTPNAGLDSNSSMAYTPNNNLFTPISSNLGLTPPQAGFGTSATGQRRDSLGSLDYQQGQVPQLNHFYGPLGTAAASPAGPMGLVQPGQSLTPPPSLSGSNTNLSLAALGGGNRLYNAAPGAEARFKNGTLGGSLLSGSLLAASRGIPFNRASLSKEVTGRSRLLEDFRNNRIPNLQLKDLLNHVVEFSQDQHGSRFIQQKLERATPAEKVMVFNEILTAAYSLMTDVFGNYVIQKFFEFGSPEQKQTLAQRVRGQVLPLALQMYGCRVIQKALESIPADMQVEIVKELDGHVLKCVKDQNGNHVVQKCIECVDPKHLQFIIDSFKGQVFTLSSHPYGCRVIQRILEHCNLDQTGPILEELHQQTERLVQDQYGNYVIQHVLEHGRPEDKSKIVAGLRGKVLLLSQHKFASNVVEKCVSYSSKAERAMLIDEVCSINDGALFSMMKDQFANYVVQKMMDVAEPAQRKMLIYKIRPHVAALRKFTYGKHILAKLEKFYMKNNIDPGPIGMPPNGALP